MLVTVNVTQEDIDKGLCQSSTQCAVANAVSRVVDRSLLYKSEVLVDGHDATFIYRACGFADVFSCIPADARHWISCFDSRQTVSPFSFDLDIPDDLLLPHVTPKSVSHVFVEAPRQLVLQACK